MPYKFLDHLASKKKMGARPKYLGIKIKDTNCKVLLHGTNFLELQKNCLGNFLFLNSKKLVSCKSTLVPFIQVPKFSDRYLIFCGSRMINENIGKVGIGKELFKNQKSRSVKLHSIISKILR